MGNTNDFCCMYRREKIAAPEGYRPSNALIRFNEVPLKTLSACPSETEGEGSTNHKWRGNQPPSDEKYHRAKKSRSQFFNTKHMKTRKRTRDNLTLRERVMLQGFKKINSPEYSRQSLNGVSSRHQHFK